MSTFIAIDSQNVLAVGYSLSFIENKLCTNINILTREEQFSEESQCEFYSYEHPDVDSEIYIYEFIGEWKSFMRCTGPSSECCFIIPKTNIEFFKEMSYYFNQSLKMAEEEGDQIIVTIQDSETYKITKYMYCYYSGIPTDMMTFDLIELKL
jgi:hypothetical protein